MILHHRADSINESVTQSKSLQGGSEEIGNWKGA